MRSDTAYIEEPEEDIEINDTLPDFVWDEIYRDA